MRYVRTFFRFWWDFIVGDDRRVAAGLAVAPFLTWLLPPAVAVVLVSSVRREARNGG
ncbi:MAG TPA: hypothetical protein VGH82_06505 [Gaiellaceae bacterium]|jgi:hypothetical protein